MIFEFWIREYDCFFKDFQFVLTRMARIAEKESISSESPPQTRSTFREGSVDLWMPLEVKYIIMGGYFNVESMILNEN